MEKQRERAFCYFCSPHGSALGWEDIFSVTRKAEFLEKWEIYGRLFEIAKGLQLLINAAIFFLF